MHGDVAALHGRTSLQVFVNTCGLFSTDMSRFWSCHRSCAIKVRARAVFTSTKHPTFYLLYLFFFLILLSFGIILYKRTRKLTLILMWFDDMESKFKYKWSYKGIYIYCTLML